MQNYIEEIIWTVFFIVALVGLPAAVSAAEVKDHYTVVKISPSDRAAVMRIDGGPQKLIREGEQVGKNRKVSEIAADRVVIEEGTGKDRETVIIRIIDGKQTVERMRETPPKAQVLYGVGK